MDRFTYSEPRREHTPGFRCANKDCDCAEWAPEDLTFCEGCGKRFCSECVNEVTGSADPKQHLFACDACYKCERCGHNAQYSCAECGSFICGAHSGSCGADSETGYRVDGPVCAGGCSVRPLEVAEMEVA
jgi:hypothetical protein